MSELIYLLAAVLFILSVRGLSAPRSARLGNFLGIAGMTLAIVAALALIPPERLLPVVLALAAGGVIGVVSGQKVRMTALPQMIAAFNGLGGLAAVFLAAGEAAARRHPLFRLFRRPGHRRAGLLRFHGRLCQT